jgi:hypothetical protein
VVLLPVLERSLRRINPFLADDQVAEVVRRITVAPGSSLIENNQWRIVKAPVFVIDYLIVHELAHLLEPNHTAQFWNIIAMQVPRYTLARALLDQIDPRLSERALGIVMQASAQQALRSPDDPPADPSRPPGHSAFGG